VIGVPSFEANCSDPYGATVLSSSLQWQYILIRQTHTLQLHVDRWSFKAGVSVAVQKRAEPESVPPAVPPFPASIITCSQPSATRIKGRKLGSYTSSGGFRVRQHDSTWHRADSSGQPGWGDHMHTSACSSNECIHRCTIWTVSSYIYTFSKDDPAQHLQQQHPACCLIRLK
jgi:hypothetical protein